MMQQQFCDGQNIVNNSKQTRGIHPILFQCWASVEDVGPTLKRHWVKASCLLGLLKVNPQSARLYNVIFHHLLINLAPQVLKSGYFITYRLFASEKGHNLVELSLPV